MATWLVVSYSLQAQDRWRYSGQVDYGLAFFNQALPDFKAPPRNNSLALYGLNWRAMGAVEWDLRRRKGWTGKITGGFLGTYTNIGKLEGVGPTPGNIRLWSLPLHVGVRNYNFTDPEDPFRKRYVGLSVGLHYNQLNSFFVEGDVPGLMDPKRRLDGAIQFEAGSVISISSHWFLDFGYSATIGTELLAGRLQEEEGYDDLFRRAGAAHLFLLHLRIGYDSQKARTGPTKRYFNLYQN